VVFEAGMGLKEEDKKGTYVKQTRNLLDNIQLVDSAHAIMHATDETGGSKPLGLKEEINTNMTIFFAYAPVGSNVTAFTPKTNNNSVQTDEQTTHCLSNLGWAAYATRQWHLIVCFLHSFFLSQSHLMTQSHKVKWHQTVLLIWCKPGWLTL
jgi:hypothetical protein